MALSLPVETMAWATNSAYTLVMNCIPVGLWRLSSGTTLQRMIQLSRGGDAIVESPDQLEGSDMVTSGFTGQGVG
jgi:hypothetical protein